MTVSNNSSQRPATGLAASVKKREIYVISETDPRSKDLQYLKSVSGQVIVLSEIEYAKYVNSLASGSGSGSWDFLDASENAEDYGNLNTTLVPPVSLIWDSVDPDSTNFVTIDGQVLVDLTISFDPGVLGGDDTIEYRVHFEPISDNTTITKINASTLNTVTATSSTISISWNEIPKATSYYIYASGANLPGTFGQESTEYLEDAAINNVKGIHTWVLNQSDSPKYGGGSVPSTFIGEYQFYIAVVYDDKTTSTTVNSGAVGWTVNV
jgi:hypothetical protein